MSDTELDELALGILEALHFSESDWCDTTEIKDYMGFSGDNGKLHHRRRYHFEPNDLVDTKREQKDGTSILEWRITEAGEKRLLGHLEQEESVPIHEQMEQLSQSVAELTAMVTGFREDLEAFECRITEADKKQSEFEESIEEGLDSQKDFIDEWMGEIEQRVDAIDTTQERNDMSDLLDRFEKAELVDSTGVRWGYRRGELLKNLEALQRAGVLDHLVEESGVEKRPDF